MAALQHGRQHVLGYLEHGEHVRLERLAHQVHVYLGHRPARAHRGVAEVDLDVEHARQLAGQKLVHRVGHVQLHEQDVGVVFLGEHAVQLLLGVHAGNDSVAARGLPLGGGQPDARAGRP